MGGRDGTGVFRTKYSEGGQLRWVYMREKRHRRLQDISFVLIEGGGGGGGIRAVTFQNPLEHLPSKRGWGRGGGGCNVYKT